MQQWAVLLAEFAAPIEYMKGRDNVWADMLSSLRSSKQAEEPVEIHAIDIEIEDDTIPFIHLRVGNLIPIW